MIKNSNVNVLHETLNIIEKGEYSKNGKIIRMKLSDKDYKKAVVFTSHELENIKRENLKRDDFLDRCNYSVTNQDSFSAAVNIYEDFFGKTDVHLSKILVLNFANPFHPGGGVRRGAKAQEEDLCRKSTLLLSLESEEADKYYDFNRKNKSYLSVDSMILSPNVEIIRGADGDLLDNTAVVSVLTCAAPIVAYGTQGLSKEEVDNLIYNRILYMLHLAAAYKYKYLVLGAWGCGEFGNDAKVISEMFYKAFREIKIGKLIGQPIFERVVFAVLDTTHDKYNYNAFHKKFGDFYKNIN